MTDLFNNADDVPEDSLDDTSPSASSDSDFPETSYDFDKVDLPETDLPFIIKEVVYEEKVKDGKPSKGVRIQLTVDGSDYEFLQPYDGRYHSEYIWLGNENQNPYGLKRFMNFIEMATGSRPSGRIDWAALGFQRKTGTDTGTLNNLSGLSVGGQMVKEMGSDNVERLKVKVWKDASQMEPLEKVEEDF